MMRKQLLFILVCLGIVSTFQAQEEQAFEENVNESQPKNEFNQWSIDFNAGVTNPTRPFTDNYFVNTPDFFHGDIGVRYMFNEKAGLKVDFGYDHFVHDQESFPFESRLFRASLQGVLNLGNIAGFRDWTNTVNLLFHGGMGYSNLKPQEPVELEADNMLNFIAGITPQIKLADRVALNADLSIIGHVRQDYRFDGITKNRSNRGFDGMYVNATLGLSVYLGKNKVHADWYSRENTVMTALDSVESRLTKLENDLQDTDRDGVADYLDREPDTVSGVTVDTKGVAVDKNNNGIPDELESALDSRYVNTEEYTNTGSGGDIIKKLINDGYVNVYFQFNSTQPETYSYESINYLIKYMKENSGSTAQLIGYADEIGNPQYNQRLSERRAQRVKDILVASGVDESRLSVTGNGEDNSVNKNSGEARQLVRRVTFKLN